MVIIIYTQSTSCLKKTFHSAYVFQNEKIKEIISFDLIFNTRSMCELYRSNEYIQILQLYYHITSRNGKLEFDDAVSLMWLLDFLRIIHTLFCIMNLNTL